MVLKQNGIETRRFEDQAVEQQERSAVETDKEGIGSVARVWSSSDRSNSGILIFDRLKLLPLFLYCFFNFSVFLLEFETDGNSQYCDSIIKRCSVL